MSAFFDIASLEWQVVRPDVTQGAFGKTFLDGKVKGVLTRLEPGGKFVPHRDNYGHVFYFLSGQGFVRVGDKQISAREGVVVQVMAGEEHEYGNNGTDDLVLISLNIPT
jgi:quercetin dioxygenase-like cupin family protein